MRMKKDCVAFVIDRIKDYPDDVQSLMLLYDVTTFLNVLRDSKVIESNPSDMKKEIINILKIIQKLVGNESLVKYFEEKLHTPINDKKTS
jgi:hypothetical protein